MNLAQVKEIKSEDIEYGGEYLSTKFRVLKLRAKNKLLTYSVQKGFYPIFLKYIKLREFVVENFLDSNPEEFFFLLSSSGKPTKINMAFSTKGRKRLRQIIDKDIFFTARQLRLNKSNFLLKESDIETAASSLQTSRSTLIKNYAGQRQETANIELTDFFSLYHDLLKQTSDQTLKQMSVGNCSDFSNPDGHSLNQPVRPDCKKIEGCFFCKNFALHKDKTEIRKLLSYKHVITVSQNLFSSSKSSNLLSAIIAKTDKMVDIISQSIGMTEEELKSLTNDIIFEENLSPFWEKNIS